MSNCEAQGIGYREYIPPSRHFGEKFQIRQQLVAGNGSF
jgi:hypothetical protein